MVKFVVVMLALVMVKVGNGKPRVSPIVLDRMALELDLKKNERGQYHFAGTGKIMMEQTLSREERKPSGFSASLVCNIPVSIDIPGDMAGLNDALTAELKQISLDSGLNEGPEHQHFTTGFFGFTKGKAHPLSGGTYKGLFGRYSFRLAKQLEGIETKGVTGVVNDQGLGLMLPIGSDFNRLLVVDIRQAAETPLTKSALCEEVRKNGFTVKE